MSFKLFSIFETWLIKKEISCNDEIGINFGKLEFEIKLSPTLNQILDNVDWYVQCHMYQRCYLHIKYYFFMWGSMFGPQVTATRRSFLIASDRVKWAVRVADRRAVCRANPTLEVPCNISCLRYTNNWSFVPTC